MRRRVAPTLALRESAAYQGQQCRLHAVVFEDAGAALAAAKRLREENFVVVDVHSPFPIHGLEKALGWRETRLGYATLVGGLLGLGAGVGLQAYVHGWSWPANIGGKTTLAWPAMVPVAFELTVLFAAIATVLGLLYSRRLWPDLTARVSIGQPGDRINDNQIVLVILEHDASFSFRRLSTVCEELAPTEVVEGYQVLS